MQRRDFLAVSGLSAGALCLNPTAALFRAAEGQKPGPFAFVVVGDTHFARAEHYDPEKISAYSKSVCQSTADSWDALWDEVTAQLRAGDPRPSFVLHLGDYVHGDCPTPEKSQQHYRDFVESLAGKNLPAPLMLTRGNHDVQGSGVRAAYDAHMPAFLKKVAPASQGQAYYAFDVGPAARVVVLDVYRTSNRDAQLDPGQAKWLEADLAAYRQRCPRGLLLVAAHAPLFPMQPRGAVFDADPAAHAELLARLVKYRAHAFLCGHLHLHSALTYTDPAAKHVLTQVMTYAINPKGEVKAAACKTPRYEGKVIADVEYRKPAELEAMRKIADALAPDVTGFKYASVPGYLVVKVDEAQQVTVTAYRGLGRRVYETFTLPRA